MESLNIRLFINFGLGVMVYLISTVTPKLKPHPQQLGLDHGASLQTWQIVWDGRGYRHEPFRLETM